MEHVWIPKNNHNMHEKLEKNQNSQNHLLKPIFAALDCKVSVTANAYVCSIM